MVICCLFLCVFQLYKHDDPDCSELCECNLGEVLSCKVLECIERDACNTGVAFYSHASPFYQAYRGQCLCYSGSFVCSKPPKGNSGPYPNMSHLVVNFVHNCYASPFYRDESLSGQLWTKMVIISQ